jgi:hypothetical protein
MSKNRVRDWQGFTDPQFRQQVASDLDELDGDLSDGMRAMRAEMAEVKEQQKWILRTMWALLVGLLMVMAGIAASVVVP